MELFNEIDGHFKDFEIHYKCPSEPEIKPQWMKDYVRSMQKWDVEHPDITVRTVSLRQLLEKVYSDMSLFFQLRFSLVH